MPASCNKCTMQVNVGEMAVFALRSGPDTCWHVQCFVCSEDGELLVDLIYCWDEEKQKLYCPRHWSESLKPRCAGCEEVCICYGNNKFCNGCLFDVRHGFAVVLIIKLVNRWPLVVSLHLG